MIDLIRYKPLSRISLESTMLIFSAKCSIFQPRLGYCKKIINYYGIIIFVILFKNVLMTMRATKFIVTDRMLEHSDRFVNNKV